MKRLRVLVVALLVSSTAVFATSFNKLELGKGIALKEFKHIKLNDSIIEKEISNEGKAYEVVRHAPGLNYTIVRVGNGNTVLFARKGGNWDLPEMTIYQNSGFRMMQGKKKGFKSVSFPFKAYISANVGWSGDISRQVNDFEIIIYEEGIWQISFN